MTNKKTEESSIQSEKVSIADWLEKLGFGRVGNGNHDVAINAALRELVLRRGSSYTIKVTNMDKDLWMAVVSVLGVTSGPVYGNSRTEAAIAAMAEATLRTILHEVEHQES